ncbi:hypothetical protein V5P93_002979 [Actinokineospora auranticolor]|uniref:Uncharacterized protein n=1 Tax=Actinokineospora auranticolor TaxID=155976 RepID=A0A2S6H119_9PSEU|nr:hypothetical protein [Actinokineospora auranticolor]PPK71116.1 hypothetical protein CLV40_101305 [Actinokineospora auranticolor]
MSADARLLVQAAVWGGGDNRVAVLLVEGRGGSAPALTAALLNSGLVLVTELDRVALPRARGWRVRVARDRRVSVTWPFRGPLLRAADLELPGVWRWAARERGAVVLLAGSRLGLAESDAGRRRELLRVAAESGTIAGAAVPFVEFDHGKEVA